MFYYKIFRTQKGKEYTTYRYLSDSTVIKILPGLLHYTSFSLLKHFKSDRDTISLNSKQSVCILENMDMFLTTHSANFILSEIDHNSVM